LQHEILQSNPQEDREIIEKIDPEYYQDIDTSLYELEVSLCFKQNIFKYISALESFPK